VHLDSGVYAAVDKEGFVRHIGVDLEDVGNDPLSEGTAFVIEVSSDTKIGQRLWIMRTTLGPALDVERDLDDDTLDEHDPGVRQTLKHFACDHWPEPARSEIGVPYRCLAYYMAGNPDHIRGSVGACGPDACSLLRNLLASRDDALRSSSLDTPGRPGK